MVDRPEQGAADDGREAVRELDARGLRCPLPVLRARKALREMAAGGQLRVLATDPGAPKDFVAFCEATGHVLEASEQRDDVFVLVIRRAG